MIDRILEFDQRWTLRLRLVDRPGPLRSLAVVFAHSGDSWFWALALIPIAVAASPEAAYIARVMLVAVAVTAVLVLAIKFSIRRRRPEGEWGQIYRKTDPHSFPSGHAARAALLAVLGWGLGPPWLGWTLTSWALLVILARVAMGVHYLLDVIAGMVLGILIGLSILAIVL